MPQAALALAVWVGNAAFVAAGASGAFAVAAGYAAVGATLAAEVYTVAKASQALTPKISDPGSATTWTSNPRAGAPYLIGRCAAAGDIVFNQSSGSSNKYLSFATVYTWAGPIDGWDSELLLNDVPTSFTADGGEGASGYYLNRMWFKHQLGSASDQAFRWTATGSKDTPANHGGMPSEWTLAHKLPGFAADFWTLEYDTQRYAGGVPQRKRVGRWVKAYDPRQDSTYPGGSGPQRWNAESTWTWTRNPYCHALTWLIGRHANGVKLFGCGYDIGEIDVAAYVEGANVADANGWTVDGRVTSLDDKWEVLKAILQMGGGLPILGSSQVSCLVNTPKVSLTTIRGRDAIGAFTVPGMADPADRINTVWPSYTEEALNWAYVTPDLPVQVPEYVAEDGREISREIKYQLGVNATQVGQLSRYAIEDSRELNGIIIQAKPWTMWLRPGDCFTASEPEWGLNGQKLLILKRTRDPATKTIAFTCRTETDGKHPYALGQTNVPPDSPTLTNIDPSVVPLPGEGAWTIVGGVVANDDGSLPAIVIEGEADFYGASQIVVDFREILGAGSYGPWQSQSFPPTATRLIVTGVKPGATYQVRVRYVTAGGVENPNTGTGLGNVTTGDLVSKGVKTIGGLTPQQVIDELRAATQTGTALSQSTLELALNAIEERGQLISETYHNGVKVKRILIDEDQEWEEGDKTFWSRMNLMAVLAPDGNSMVINQDTLMWSPTESLAEHVEAIRTQIGTTIAAYDSSIKTWVNSSSFGVTWINALNASNGGNFQAAFAQTATLASNLGGKYTLAFNINGHVSGLYLANTGTTSSFIVSASQIGFSNGGSDILYPLAIVGGVVKATNFEADRIRANSIVASSIVGGEITDSVVSVSGSYVGLSVGSWDTLRSLSYYSRGGRLEVYTQSTINSASSDSYVSFRVLIDGFEQDSWPNYVKGGAYDRSVSITDATPSAGWHTVEFQGKLEPGSGSAGSVNHLVRITEHKTET